MKNNIRALCVLLLFSLTHHAQTCREVIGYYPNWQWYDRTKLVNPASIRYENYSIINYCFFKPETNGAISNTDNWADENLLQGQINWSTNPVSYYPNTNIIDLAHNSGTKVMVSIGGWTLSDNFPGIAADVSKRSFFASECCRLIRFYHFDGIDIDWEYPGFAEHGGTPSDKQNFTLLLQEIRDSLDILEAEDNRSYLLSACFSGDPLKAQDIEWSNVEAVLDMINIMSYDFFGTWDCAANHNSPLFAPASGNPAFNIDSAFQLLTSTYNVNPGKINIGVAFYGRTQTGATSLYQPTDCSANNTLFYEDDGTPLYYNVMKNISLFDRYWDASAEVPYLLGKSSTAATGTFVSYDDEEAIAKKAQYVINHNARGVIIWEITGDYIETSPGSGIIASTPLADTLNNVFCNTGSVSFANPVPLKSTAVFPNPATDQLNITTQIPADIEILDLAGSGVVKYKSYGKTKLDISQLLPGVYILRIINKEKVSAAKFIKL